jgi:hypothetical protein
MPRGIRQEVLLDDVRLIFRNFSGEARTYNDKGKRNFNVILDEETAKAMEKDGWNIKRKQPWEEGDPELLLLKVNIKYWGRDGRRLKPPKVVIITSLGKTSLTEDMISLLDWAEITHADLIINPWEYEPGKLTAYLDSLYVHIKENELELRYRDVPETGQSAIITEPFDDGGPD